MFDHPVSMQDVMVEKTQRAYGLVERRPRELFPLDQEQLVLSDVFRSESIWCSFKSRFSQERRPAGIQSCLELKATS
jgi:hypothetical protein